MPFVKVPGLKGRLYVPETNDKTLKKHPCKDCHACQVCSDDRCSVCLGEKTEAGECQHDGNSKIK